MQFGSGVAAVAASNRFKSSFKDDLWQYQHAAQHYFAASIPDALASVIRPAAQASDTVATSGENADTSANRFLLARCVLYLWSNEVANPSLFDFEELWQIHR